MSEIESDVAATICSADFLLICDEMRSCSIHGGLSVVTEDIFRICVPERGKARDDLAEAAWSAWVNCREDERKFASALAAITGCDVEFCGHTYRPN